MPGFVSGTAAETVTVAVVSDATPTVVAEILRKARYSGHEVTEDERTYVADFTDALREASVKDLAFGTKMKLKYVWFLM
ncbi:hypothetical protein FACS1894105_13950 [Clostridia bacterium]|nr:hypothetical protein FACS1894105_13950 [Clostridia bacterium]